MLSKAASSNILKVFGMIRPGIEPQSPRSLANTLLIWPMAQLYIVVECSPKTQKIVLDAALVNTLHYKVCIKSKRSNPGNGVVLSV